MRKRYFITGTDTDAGKTVVTAGLAALCVSKGLRTAVVKPVQTGTADYPPDIETVRRLAPGICETAPAPHMLPFAASPHLAAAEAGVRIDMGDLKRHVEDVISEAGPDVLLVEGAGGVLVPLNEKETMLDLMRELGFPVILVARPGLGTINHTLLSVRALRDAGVEVCGIIFNRVSENPGKIEADNLRTVERMSGIRVLGATGEVPVEKGGAEFLSAFSKGMRVEFPV